MKILFIAAASLALAACLTRPVVTTQQISCTALVPSDWKQGVMGIPLPGLDSAVGELWSALDAQTGKLDQANGHTKDAIGIVERCEARDAAGVKRGSRGFFGRLFGG